MRNSVIFEVFTTTNMTVHLTGTENLPPFIKSMLDSKYNYHAHELKCEPTEDGFNYKYSVTVSQVPLNCNQSRSSSVSQTLSESTTNRSTDDDDTTTTQSVRYRIQPIPCSNSVRCVMMVQVKFILLHLDAFGNRVQSMFIEEVSTDETLNDIISSFREACLAKMSKNKTFSPRMSYCIGEVTRQNSKPINPQDLEKSISQLAEQPHLIGKVVFVADTLNYF